MLLGSVVHCSWCFDSQSFHFWLCWFLGHFSSLNFLSKASDSQIDSYIDFRENPNCFIVYRFSVKRIELHTNHSAIDLRKQKESEFQDSREVRSFKYRIISITFEWWYSFRVAKVRLIRIWLFRPGNLGCFSSCRFLTIEIFFFLTPVSPKLTRPSNFESSQ